MRSADQERNRGSSNKALERTAVTVGWRVSAEVLGGAAAQLARYRSTYIIRHEIRSDHRTERNSEATFQDPPSKKDDVAFHGFVLFSVLHLSTQTVPF
jgi:hypothetical protein